MYVAVDGVNCRSLFCDVKLLDLFNQAIFGLRLKEELDNCTWLMCRPAGRSALSESGLVLCGTPMCQSEGTNRRSAGQSDLGM